MKKTTRCFTLLVSTICVLSLLCAAQSRRDLRDKPEKLMDIVGVKPGMIIGEAGAGDGYLSFHLSRRVGAGGRVYANDINRRALQRLNDRCEREGVTNITTVTGKIADPLYPVNDLDMIVMIYAFHDFTEKTEWLRNAKKYIKPSAPVVIFDDQDSHTKLSKEYVATLADDAGYNLTHFEKFHNGLYIYILHLK
ncbi:MAG: class I SAM-dependent methyltransferase [Candidatus Aminicenantes bacterium]|nr:class I SAM-dependent methyltransferase [Candidatus Aminicenantes bacterium]